MKKTTVLTVLVIVASAAAHAAPPSPKEINDAAREGKELARERMKDPESAKLRNLFVSSRGPTETEDSLANVLFLCGEINAKNSYGGYIGFHRFAASKEGGFTLEEDDDYGAFRQVVWDKYCVRKIRDVK